MTTTKTKNDKNKTDTDRQDEEGITNDTKMDDKEANKNKEPRIFWGFWTDPFDIDKLNLPDDLSEEEDLDNLYGGEYEKRAEERENNFVDTSMLTKKPFKLAITQIGVIPFYESTLPSKLFKFWEGHTNFNITQKVIDVIDETEGVETLEVYSRYRLRLSVGKAFDSRTVRQEIQKNICKLFAENTKNGV